MSPIRWHSGKGRTMQVITWSVVVRGWDQGGKNRRAQSSLPSVNMCCVLAWWWIHVMRRLSKPMKCTSPRVSFNSKYGLRVISMHLCRFLFGKRCTILVCYVNNGRRRICVMAGNTWGMSVPSLCSCWEPKTVFLFVCLLRNSLTVKQLSLCLSMQTVRVWSLVWELRSCMSHSQKKKKSKTEAILKQIQ